MLKIISSTLTLSCLLSLPVSFAQELTFTPEMSQATIQKQLDNAARSKKVVFSPGEYTKISSLKIDPLLVSSVHAKGARFRFPAEQKKFTRLFNIIWTNKADSPPLLFDGGEFDMNEQNQSRESYNKEHQAAIFADAPAEGRLDLIIQNVTVRNSAGDGISIHRNSVVSIKDCAAKNCFRGGLTVSAGGNEITVNNLDVRGHRFHSGLRFEPGSMTSRQLPSKYLLKHIRANYLNFQLGASSTLTMTDSKLEAISPRAAKEGFQGYFYNEGGKLLFDRCQFFSNRPLNFQLTGDSTIRNSEFQMSRYDETDRPDSSIAITLRWYYKPAGKFNDNQTFTLSNCTFSSQHLPQDSATPYAIRTFETHPYGGENNQIIIQDVQIADDGPWGALYIHAGKESKTKLILKDNVHGDEKLGERE